jgi:hypothetical protein
MRTALLPLCFLAFATAAQAQTDPAAAATQASEQASKQAMQALQQAMQDAQRANEQAMANLNNASQNNTPVVAMTMPPKISVKPGTYTKPITVRLSNRSRGAIMYYTTDGWTPTTASTRYVGPFTIDSTTKLQVIAIAPYCARSMVASAIYTFPGSTSASSASLTSPPASTSTDPLATPVHFVFAADVNSKSAEIGDKIPLTLAADLTIGGTVVARKGAHASVTIMQVDKTGAGGAPGTLEFQIDPLVTDAGPLKLRGSNILEGKASPPNATALIPVVGLFTLFHHGQDAEIKSGTPYTAYFTPPSIDVAAK